MLGYKVTAQAPSTGRAQGVKLRRAAPQANKVRCHDRQGVLDLECHGECACGAAVQDEEGAHEEQQDLSERAAAGLPAHADLVEMMMMPPSAAAFRVA